MMDRELGTPAQPPRGAGSTGDRAATLIDLTRYPLDRLESAEGQDFIARCRRTFEDNGVCLLKGFLVPEALQEMTVEAASVAPEAFYCHKQHTAFLGPADESLPADHPRRHMEDTYVGSVASDLLPPEGPLITLYRWPPLLEFLAGIIALPRLYHFADPLGAVSVNVFQAGGQHGWHFDEASFSVTLMLQTAETGGLYEYIPGLRQGDVEDTEALAKILAGGRQGVITMDFQPGDFLVFAGRDALHRVTTVEGDRLRLVPVLSFSARPDDSNSPEVRELFWGRSGPPGESA